MLTTEQLTRAVIDFLRIYGHLDDPERKPEFKAEDFEGFIHPLAMRDTWRQNDPVFYQAQVSGDDIYKANFKRFELPEVFNDEFQSMPLNDIPNSKDYVLIDIGSSLGRWITRPFAKQRPNVEVFMIDFLTREQIQAQHNYAKHANQKLAEPIYRRVEVTENIEDSVNRMLRINNYPNITYIQKWLKYNDMRLGIEDSIKGKKVYVTGHRNPEGLGNLTVMKAIELDAEGVYVNNPWIERNPTTSEHWNLMTGFLSRYLSEHEVKKTLNLMYDPENTREEGKTSKKYNYQIPEQRMFGYALKLLFVLAQKELLERNGYEVNIFTDKYSRGFGNYSAPNQNLVAKKLK